MNESEQKLFNRAVLALSQIANYDPTQLSAPTLGNIARSALAAIESPQEQRARELEIMQSRGEI